MVEKKSVANAGLIEKQIVLLRGERVMLSTDLAGLYGVEPRVLVQAVKRNLDRFPDDFMFQLTRDELINLKSQFVISSWGGLRRASPYAFTEQGVAMLSNVLRSPRAVQVNIEIMRTFVRLRRMVASNAEPAQRLLWPVIPCLTSLPRTGYGGIQSGSLDTRLRRYDELAVAGSEPPWIQSRFDAIRQLMAPLELGLNASASASRKPGRSIGRGACAARHCGDGDRPSGTWPVELLERPS